MAYPAKSPLSTGDNVQQFYQVADAIESRLSNFSVSNGPFDPELANQFQRAQDLFSKALPTIKAQPAEVQKLTTRNLKIQLLRTMVEQNDFQRLLIATVAGTTSITAPIPTGGDANRTGAGRVAYSDKNGTTPVAILGARVNDSTIDYNY